MLREAACLQLAERLFQSFTPLNEKHFLPFSVPFFGNLRSVDALRSLYDVLCEFFLNKLRKCGGARCIHSSRPSTKFPNFWPHVSSKSFFVLRAKLL